MQAQSFLPALISAVAVLGAGGASAEVLDAAAGGFSTRYSVDISANRLQVYESLVDDVGKWWSDDHTVSGSAANLYINARAQGCFCEVLGDEASLVHMTVTFANPGVILRMTGGLGPLGLMGVAGNMTFALEEIEDATTVTLQYAVGGYTPGGLEKVAPAVDGVLAEALDRLKRFVEHGNE